MSSNQPNKQPRPRTFAEVTGVQYPQPFVDFVIPDLARDLPYGVYLTAQLAALSDDPTVARIHLLTRGYFQRLDEVLTRARNHSDVALRMARRMVDFPEPSEFGFGFTKGSWRGCGVGNGELSIYLLEVLYECPTLSAACAVHPDALAFVPLVAIDRVSDVIANVAKDAFIQYTAERAAAYRFDPTCLRETTIRHVWDPEEMRFVDRRALLPVRDDGGAILLAPKEIVRSSPPVRTTHYTAAYHGVRRPLAKGEILAEAEGRPERLIRLMDKIFEEVWRYQPRKAFRRRLDS